MLGDVLVEPWDGGCHVRRRWCCPDKAAAIECRVWLAAVVARQRMCGQAVIGCAAEASIVVPKLTTSDHLGFGKKVSCVLSSSFNVELSSGYGAA